MAGKKDIEIKDDITEEEVIEKKVTEKKVRVQLNREELVICESVFDGILNFTNPRTLENWQWRLGDEQELTIGDLLLMNSGKNKLFLTTPWIILDTDNDELIERLGLSELYNNIEYVKNAEALFKLPLAEFKKKLKQLPETYKSNIGSLARTMIEDGRLYDKRKIKALEDELNIEIE